VGTRLDCSNRAKSCPVEGKLSEKTASADNQEHSDHAYPLTPKPSAESGRFAA
jgi:hypothetical protein